MTKAMMIGGLAAVAACAATAAAPKATDVPVFNHVPATLDAETPRILPAAKDRNHVLIVNVGGAVPEDVFPTLVTYTLSRININAWTNSIDKSMVEGLIGNPDALAERFGKHAVVAVFLEKNEKGLSFLNAPGHWSMVNLRGLDRDKPDAQKLKDRMAKMLLKGIAHAAGVGASVDNLCALNYDSFTLLGMDKTDIRLSAMAYFPMLATLRALGGDDMVAPPAE